MDRFGLGPELKLCCNDMYIESKKTDGILTSKSFPMYTRFSNGITSRLLIGVFGSSQEPRSCQSDQQASAAPHGCLEKGTQRFAEGRRGGQGAAPCGISD